MDKMFIKLNMKIKFKKHILPLFALLVLTNCSAIAPASMESSFKYLGIAKGAVDVASYNATGKTSTDHLFSAAIGKDCKISRIIKRQPICVEFDAKTGEISKFIPVTSNGKNKGLSGDTPKVSKE